MRSIAVTKPDMGVLPRERLLLSPFGTLAQAFAEELLARARQEEGAWSHVPLELLEEGETAPASAAPANVTLQVDLRLVLEALRREGERTEQRQAAERIVERVLQLQARREPPRQVKEGVTAPAGPGSMTVLNTVRQEFHQNLTQNIHITQSLPREKDLRDRRMPGDLARQAEAFSQRLQTLREEGAALPRRTGRDGEDGFQLYAGAGSGASEQASPLPREALRLLEEQGTSEARTAAEALDREGRRLLERLTETLEGAEKSAPELRQSREAVSVRRESAAGKGTGPKQPPDRTGPAGPAVPAAGEMTGGRPLPAAARDIRIHPAGRPGGEETAPKPHTGLAEAEERAQVPPQAPVELSHRTEPETGGASSREPAARSYREHPGESHRTGRPAVQAVGEKPESSAPAGEDPRQERGQATAGGKREDTRRTGRGPKRGQESVDAVEADRLRTGIRQMPIQARDIRVGPTGRTEGGETAGRPKDAAPRSENAVSGGKNAAVWQAGTASEQRRAPSGLEAGNDGPGQSPVELTHRTEGETGETVSRDPGTGTDRKPFDGRADEGTAEKRESRPATGRRPERDETITEQAGELLAGARQMPTQARDIRVGPEGRPERGETAAFQQERAAFGPEAGNDGSAQPPVELAHRTGPETGEGIPRERRTETDRVRPEKRSRQESAEKREDRPRTGRRPKSAERRADRPHTGRRPERERTEAGEIGGPQTSVRRMPTQARDIRVGPEGRPGRDETAGRPETAASRQARDAFGPEVRSDGFTRPPVELSHRTEPETDIQAAAISQTAAGRGRAAQKGAARTLAPAAERPADRGTRAGEGPARREGRGAAAMAPAVGRGLYPAARDIRTGAGHRLGGVPGTGTFHEMAEDLSAGGAAPDAAAPTDLEHPAQAAARPLPPELALHLLGTAGDGPVPEDPSLQTGVPPAGGDRSGREPTRPEPLPLTYGPGQPVSARQPERSGEPRTGETDYVRSLPDWARRFLREGAPETPGSRVMGVARDIASLPQTEPKDTVQWTAPGYRPPEAPMAYREKERTQPQEGGEVHISDAEIRRTADKVYRMIEERLRRERRRLGF